MATTPIAPSTARAAFDYSNLNTAVPTVNQTPVSTDTPAAVELNAPGTTFVAPPTAAPGTNPGYLTPHQAYSTTAPAQASYNWSPQTAGTASQTTPTSPAPQSAWGTGNGDAQAHFDPQAYINWMLQPSVQAGFAGMATKRQ